MSGPFPARPRALHPPTTQANGHSVLSAGHRLAVCDTPQDALWIAAAIRAARHGLERASASKTMSDVLEAIQQYEHPAPDLAWSLLMDQVGGALLLALGTHQPEPKEGPAPEEGTA